MSKVRLGIIGSGGRGIGAIAINVLPQLQDKVELVALCDTNRKRLKAADELVGGGNRLYGDYRDLLADDDMNVVLITTPDSTHEEIAVSAFEAGKHVFCEKPLATTVQGCDSILAAAEKSGKVLEVGFVLRYAPIFRKINELIHAGEIGRPVFIRTADFYVGGRGYFNRWHRLRRNSGGLFVHKGCHMFDFINWTLQSRPVRVSATGSVDVFVKNRHRGGRCSACDYECSERLNRQSPIARKLLYEPSQDDETPRDICIYNSEKDVFDNGFAIVEYENGARAEFGMCFFPAKSRKTFHAVGDEGELLADTSQNRIEIIKRFSKEVIEYALPAFEGGHYGGDLIQVRDFIEAVGRNQPALASGEAGRLSTAVGVAAELAARENRIVEIRELLD